MREAKVGSYEEDTRRLELYMVSVRSPVISFGRLPKIARGFYGGPTTVVYELYVRSLCVLNGERYISFGRRPNIARGFYGGGSAGVHLLAARGFAVEDDGHD